MQNWDRPPPDIAVAELFERWLPEAFAATGHRAPAGAPVVRVTIAGTGGGTWEVHADGTSLSVTPAGRELLTHELVHVIQQRDAAPNGPLRVSEPGDALEREADDVARGI